MDWVVFLGIVTGMRAMTGVAVVCWAAWLSWLPERGWSMWTTYLLSAIVFTVFALGEYVGDTRPTAPNRTAPVPALARLVFGGLVGALAAAAILQPVAGGVLAGMGGAAIGTWGGFALRMWTAKRVGRDWPVALAESALALGLALSAVWHLHLDILSDRVRGAP